MNTPLSRRAVLRTVPVLALVPAVLTTPADAHTPLPRPGAPSLPQLDPSLAREIVGASHGNTEKVKGLLKSHPELAKAAMDWGFGDWETAIGAASHTGQREIAQLLIENGARPDIFTFAMLGNIAALKAMIDGQPGVQRLLGPHGLSLAHHARTGREQAKEALDYLLSLGDADTGHPSTPITDDERAACAGEYVCTDSQRFVIMNEKNALQFKVEGWFPRTLIHQGEHTFHPAGAPSVRLRFTIKDARAASVTISDGVLLAEATRA